MSLLDNKILKELEISETNLMSNESAMKICNLLVEHPDPQNIAKITSHKLKAQNIATIITVLPLFSKLVEDNSDWPRESKRLIHQRVIDLIKWLKSSSDVNSYFDKLTNLPLEEINELVEGYLKATRDPLKATIYLASHPKMREPGVDFFFAAMSFDAYMRDDPSSEMFFHETREKLVALKV